MRQLAAFWILWFSFASVLTAAVAIPPGKNTTTLQGTVVDESTGNGIPDAEIWIEGLPRHATSGDGGYFFMDNVPPGEWTLHAGVIGYRKQTRTHVRTDGAESVRLALTPEPIRMDPVLVTGTRSEHLRSQVTVSSRVLTADWIGNRNGNTAAEVIENAGGLYVKDGGGFAGLKTLSIRGSGDSEVLVLLDGQRLNAAQDGSVDISSVPAESLEKIEIVRGGHSALMGTDAVGGAVNLMTKNALPSKGLSGGLQSTAGSFGTRMVGTYGSGRMGPAEIYLAYNRSRSEGNFSFVSPLDHEKKTRENNDFTGDHLLFKMRVNLADGGKVQFIGHWTLSERGSADPVTFDFPSSRARRNERQNLYSLLVDRQILKRVRLNAQTYLQDRENRFSSLLENDRHDNTAAGLDLYTRWMVHPAALFTVGFEMRRDALESTKFDRQRRDTRSLTLQSEISHPLRMAGLDMKWKWIPAVRRDGYSADQGRTSPKIGVLIHPFRSFDLDVRGNAGRSFRLPTFNDLYWPEIIQPGFGGVRGNRALLPESGENWDIGIVWRGARLEFLSAELTYFQNRIKDLILWESDADWVYSPRNVGRALISGIECDGSVRLPGDRAYMTVSPTWMVSKDLTAAGGPGLVYRPDYKIDVNAGVKISRLRLNADVQAVGRRYTMPGNARRLPPYSLVGGNIQWNASVFGFTLRSKFQVINLLDKSIFLVEGYPIPGRELRFTLGFDW
jgi:outer membrane cobalamin receptor